MEVDPQTLIFFAAFILVAIAAGTLAARAFMAASRPPVGGGGKD
jgi:hypothetical protein